MHRATLLVLLAGCACPAAEAVATPPPPAPAAAPAAPAPPASRLPLPPADAIAAAAKELRAILKDDLANRDPAVRAAAAQKLLDLGGKGDPAARCAALREAEDLAGRLGDVATAEKAAAALSAAFTADSEDERLRALAGCIAGASAVETVAALAETCLGMAEAAVVVDDLALAERAAQQADIAAKRLRDPGLAGRTRAELQRVRALAEEWRKVGAASDLLGQPDAGGLARRGRYRCLWKGDWTAGLPDLAKGDDAALAAAAQADLAAEQPAQQLAAGLAWADLAAKQRGDPRDALLLHAAGLIRLAVPGLDVIERARAEKRLAEIERQLGGAARRAALPPGAVLYLPFDRDTLVPAGGRTLAQDISGSGCNGLVTGAKPAAGAWGGALEFNAPEAQVDCGNPAALRITGSMTVAMWLRPAVIGGSRRNPFHKSYGSEGTMTCEHDGSINFFWGISGHDEEGHYQALDSSFALEANTWTHIAVVRDLAAKTVTWFRNGKRANSAPAQYPAAKTSEAPLLIGRGYAGPFLGMIDEFGVWPRALRDQEIAALQAATAAGR